MIVWLAAIAFGIPYLIAYKVVELDMGNGTVHYCVQLWVDDFDKMAVSMKMEKMYMWIKFIVIFVIPAAVMGYAYVRIGHRLWIRKPIGDSAQAAKVCVHYRKMCVRMCVIMMLIFIICWTPLHVFKLVLVHKESLDDCPAAAHTSEKLVLLSQFFSMLALSSCAFDPISYFLFQEKFRKHCLDIGRCRCQDNTSSVESCGIPKKKASNQTSFPLSTLSPDKFLKKSVEKLEADPKVQTIVVQEKADYDNTRLSPFMRNPAG